MSDHFRILTVLSPPYADAASIFLPSWIRNAGPADIRIRIIPACSHVEYQRQRWQILRREVLAAALHRVPIVWLDADCFILGELSRGFSDQHPISVARWPRINAGVMFFNTRAAFPWRSWLNNARDEIDRELAAGGCDQWALEQCLWDVEGFICKLNWKLWNYCDGDDWREALPKVADRVRIVHVKGLGDWHGAFASERIAIVRELFAGKV